jgi:MinD superfamily P-loop ATPase
VFLPKAKGGKLADKLSPPRHFVILSGKGGTGKTTLAAALSALVGKRVMADADVDAADLHILLKPQLQESYPYRGGKKAFIDSPRCTQCGICQDYCRFAAIQNYRIDPLACEGCGFCVQVCPEKAIDLQEVVSGFYHEGPIAGGQFVDAALQPGEGNSGKLVSQVKKRAAELAESTASEWLMVDGAPGIGCPVNASLTGADLAVIVTEPTISGLHDLERLVELLQRFHISSGLVINKADLNSTICSRIKTFAENNQLPILGVIPFDETVMTALLEEKIITDFPDSPASREIVQIFKNIRSFFEMKSENECNQETR